MVTATTATTNGPLSLEKVLKVYYTIFSAAVDAFIPPTIAYAMLCKPSLVPTVGVPVWQLWSKETLETTPPKHAVELPWRPKEWLLEVIPRRGMCTWFCWLLEKEISKKVGERFGGSARWMFVWPRISFLLAWKGNPRQLKYPPHAVLLVEADGRKRVMDATLTQYLWAEIGWLQDEEDFTFLRVDPDRQPNKAFASDSERLRLEKNAAELCDGFWVVVRERLTVLLGELNWGELRGLGADERIAHVKMLTGRGFDGAHHEAVRRWRADRVLD